MAFSVLLALASVGFLHMEKPTVKFSGYTWTVKSRSEPSGPGPNLYDASSRSVFVDEAGRLHLRIAKTAAGWACSEVYLEKPLGYGTYTFVVETPPSQIDDMAILGLFTYGDDPAFEHREIDIEISRWGDASLPNAQFAVQPYQQAGNMERFEVPKNLRRATHQFVWTQKSIQFTSKGEGFAKSWSYTGSHVPEPGDETVHLNYWLMFGKPPTVLRTYEAVISKFAFEKLKTK